MPAPAFAWERASAPPVAWPPALLGAVLSVGVFASLAAFVS